MSAFPSRKNADEVARELDAVIEAHGPWTTHNIEVAPGVFTMGTAMPGWSTRRAVQIARLISDLSPAAFESLRILDLGSLEGEITIELARRGATTVGIEAREPHVARARFAAEALGLDRASFVGDDVRNLSAQRYGSFDVVLCLGILYHLDSPDVFELLEHIAGVCRGFALVDTHVALRPREKRVHRGVEYRGVSFVEHDVDTTSAQRARRPHSSIDNPRSFWLTKPSLLDALAAAGFESLLEVLRPPATTKYRDRCLLLAMSGPGGPSPGPGAARQWPERDPRRPHASQDWRYPWRSRAARARDRLRARLGRPRGG